MQLVCAQGIKVVVLLCLVRPERTSSACWSLREPDRRLWRLTTVQPSPPNPCRRCRETDCSPTAAAAQTTCTRSPWLRCVKEYTEQCQLGLDRPKDSAGSQTEIWQKIPNYKTFLNEYSMEAHKPLASRSFLWIFHSDNSWSSTLYSPLLFKFSQRNLSLSFL